MPHHGAGAAFFLGGPAVIFSLLTILATVFLIALGVGRQESAFRFVESSSQRLPIRRGRCTLWGLSAVILDFAASGILIHSHLLALFGIALLLLGVAVLSVGFAVSAIYIGSLCTANPEDDASSPFASFWRGFLSLFLTSCVPFLGWLNAALWIAGGTGALLEGALTHEK